MLGQRPILLFAILAATGSAPAGDPGPLRPALPLRTEGRWIVDAAGKRFKLAGVNWYGAEQKDFVVGGLDRAPLAAIAASIRSMGFNSVRIPWSNEMVETNPRVALAHLAANPALLGKRALEVLDAVIEALSAEGLVVILDNHMSDADWPNGEGDGNGLWWNDRYPEESWIADWRALARRYAKVPAVVGADLRNEPRPAVLRDGKRRVPVWGGPDPKLDWRAAAERCGNAVLEENPNLLVIVEGVNFASDFSGAHANPIRFKVKNRLVWSPHDYSWFHNGLRSPEELHADLGRRWGYLLVQDQAWTAPVWVGEFGTPHGSADDVYASSGPGLWFASFRAYLYGGDIDWCYWALNGTQSRGATRTLGAEETFGVLDRDWKEPALRRHLDALRTLQPATCGP
jgi:endoglucanase